MKSRKIFILLLAALFMLVTFAGCGQNSSAGDQSLKYIKEKGKLILGLDDAFPPMGFRDADNNIVGFDIDVAKAVCQKLGVQLVLQPIDWNAKEQELNTKNIDCIWNGFSVSEERKQNITFSVPYMNNLMALVVRADSGITTLEDMNGKTLALQAGSSALNALNANESFKSSLKKVIQLSNNEQALMNLSTKSVDAVLMDSIAADYYIAQNNKDFAVLGEQSLSAEEYAIGFRKGEEALKNAVDKALKELAKDGTLAQISAKWFGKDVTIVKQ